MIQSSCVYDGLGGVVTAEHDEQVRDHSCLLVIVQFHDFLSRQFVQCHLNHRNGTFYNLLTCRDDGRSLLAAQHDGSNLGSVCQIVDAGFHHLDAGKCQTVV